MFSKSFMQFLITYEVEDQKSEKPTVEEIDFKSPKVREAAKVVVDAIKETY